MHKLDAVARLLGYRLAAVPVSATPRQALQLDRSSVTAWAEANGYDLVPRPNAADVTPGVRDVPADQLRLPPTARELVARGWQVRAGDLVIVSQADAATMRLRRATPHPNPSRAGAREHGT